MSPIPGGEASIIITSRACCTHPLTSVAFCGASMSASVTNLESRLDDPQVSLHADHGERHPPRPAKAGRGGDPREPVLKRHRMTCMWKWNEPVTTDSVKILTDDPVVLYHMMS